MSFSACCNFSINTILRDSTDLSGGTRFAQLYGSANDFPVTMSFLDSPNTTSEITYKLYFRSSSGSYTMYINRRAGDDLFRGSTSLICTEISG